MGKYCIFTLLHLENRPKIWLTLVNEYIYTVVLILYWRTAWNHEHTGFFSYTRHPTLPVSFSLSSCGSSFLSPSFIHKAIMCNSAEAFPLAEAANRERTSVRRPRERILPPLWLARPTRTNEQHCLFRSSEPGSDTPSLPLRSICKNKRNDETSVQSKLVSRGVKLGRKIGLSIRGPHVWRAHKDTRMNSCGFEEGPTENGHVQGPEFCAAPLHVSAWINCSRRVILITDGPAAGWPDGEETSQALAYNSFTEDRYELYTTYQALWIHNVQLCCWICTLLLCWFYIKNLK